MTADLHVHRPRHLRHVEARLRHFSFPRAQMALIVLLTGASGLLASFCLLHAGIHAMAVRYPQAVAAAYLSFFALLWAWLRWRTRDMLDLIPDPPLDLGGRGASTGSRVPADGHFGGGGASGGFEAAEAAPSSTGAPLAPSAGASSSAWSDLSALASVDDVGVPIAVVIAGIGAALQAYQPHAGTIWQAIGAS